MKNASLKKFVFCIGTRPEAIKLAPLVLEATRRGHPLKVIVSGQHREMLIPFLNFFGIQPDHDLDVLKPNQSLTELTSTILSRIQSILKQETPDVLFVQGDTTTALASAMAGFYEKIPVAHVEAGLRTHDRYSPFPEEMNRKLLASLADYHFAPTEGSKQNLIKEGITKNVWVTGNTGIDGLRIANDRLAPTRGTTDEKTIVVTCHRRENHGEPLKEICAAVREIVDLHPHTRVVFPVHLNPNVQATVHSHLGSHPRITLLRPLDYAEFVPYLRESHLLLTDSGGLQEEAPFFKKPVFILRESTERPEGVEAKVSELVGSSRKKIVERVSLALTNPEYYSSFQTAVNPYGDGYSSARILELI